MCVFFFPPTDIGLGSDSVCARPSSHRIKSFDSLGSQSLHSRTSKLFQGQYRSLVSSRRKETCCGVIFFFFYFIFFLTRFISKQWCNKVAVSSLSPLYFKLVMLYFCSFAYDVPIHMQLSVNF